MKTPNSLPKSEFPLWVEVAGRPYLLRGDVKSVTDFMEYIDTSQDDDALFLTRALGILYPLLPEDRDGALEAVICFYNGGTFPEEGYYIPLFPPKEKERVFREFQARYGIDLTKTPFAWQEFRRLKKGERHGG